jgi:phosphopentomutase
LILTADHGVDPAAAHTDHTREHAPLLAVFDGHGGRRHDGPLADVGASALRWLAQRDARSLPGTPFV